MKLPWNATALLALSVLLWAPTFFLQADVEVSLDADETQVTFELGATGHDVKGRLFLTEGHLVLRDDGTAMGSLNIDARKTETGSKKRDKTMHKKVLESAHHPLISFHPERYEGSLPTTGGGRLVLHGQLTILGVAHAMTLPIEVSVDGQRYRGSTQFEVPFVEWGMHDPSVLFLRVKKVVQVEVETAGVLSSSDATNEVAGL